MVAFLGLKNPSSPYVAFFLRHPVYHLSFSLSALTLYFSTSTGCPKKTHHKEMRDFLTLKMLPLALSLIKPEKRHLLAPLVKNHLFYMRI